MERLDITAVRALRSALDVQPLTGAKVTFAWTLAAGPALARSASVSWDAGVLSVVAKSEAWRDELVRARPVIVDRMAQILGAGVVRTLRILESSAPARPIR